MCKVVIKCSKKRVHFGVLHYLVNVFLNPKVGVCEKQSMILIHSHGRKVKALDAIKKVTQAEAESKQRKAEAIAAAKKLVAQAEQEGKQTLQNACAAAEAQAKEFMVRAEERAAARAAEIAAQSERDCAALCSAAETKLDEAAALIVRRVVSS